MDKRKETQKGVQLHLNSVFCGGEDDKYFGLDPITPSISDDINDDYVEVFYIDLGSNISYLMERVLIALMLWKMMEIMELGLLSMLGNFC